MIIKKKLNNNKIANAMMGDFERMVFDFLEEKCELCQSDFENNKDIKLTIVVEKPY